MDFLIWHLLRNSASRSPHKEALVHGEQRLTYEEVARQVSGLATSLRSVGMKRGERIGIYLEASVAQVVSIFGVSQAEGVYVPISAVLHSAQVMHIAHDCEMKGLITSSSKLNSLATVLPQIPSLEFLIITDEKDVPDVGLPVYRLNDLCAMQSPGRWDERAIEKDLAAILYTSGSTGKPKGVMLSHANVVAGSRIVSDYLEITEHERILAVFPFSFDAGMNQLMTAFEKGGTLVLTNFTFAREIVQMLLKEHITGLAGVPTLWSLLAQCNSTLSKQPLPDLRYITNTGGAMPQAVLKVLRAALPATKIFLMYGLTEAFRSTYLPPEELDRRPTSMGKAIPDHEILGLNAHRSLSQPRPIIDLVQR